jgi:Na+-driven multidrug efflux pump
LLLLVPLAFVFAPHGSAAGLGSSWVIFGLWSGFASGLASGLLILWDRYRPRRRRWCGLS